MATLFPHSDSFSFFFVTFISLAVLSHRHPSATAAAGCQAPPVIFNFGDSNSDTGGLVAGLGYLVGLPNGRLFFRRSTGRLCDGRLLIDFLCNSSSSRSRLAPARSRQTIKAFPIRRSRPDRRDPVPDFSSSFATSASIRSRPDRKQLDPIGVSSRPVRVQLAVHPSWWSGFNKHLGNVIADSAGQSLNTSLLRPYLDSLGESKFQNGANFAIVGSTTLPRNVPFSLNIQLMQFLHFKSRSLELASTSSKPTSSQIIFVSALFLINDLDWSQHCGFLRSIKGEVHKREWIQKRIRLYDEGGRRFWIHNTGPLGCLPQKLSMAQRKDLDQHGCLASYNAAAKLFNQMLDHMCEKLRIELRDATIIYIDIYAIKYSLIANSKGYGFERPLMACCGYGGSPYNYNSKITCSPRGANVCDKGSRFVSWDGIHYTETANAIVAMKVLSMQYSKPKAPFDFFCRR
ncbi:hypothetical protein YC2023_115457 [Brassica napus]